VVVTASSDNDVSTTWEKSLDDLSSYRHRCTEHSCLQELSQMWQFREECQGRHQWTPTWFRPYAWGAGEEFAWMRQKQRNWEEERRRAAVARLTMSTRIRTLRPWYNSSGPGLSQGETWQKSRLNAYNIRITVFTINAIELGLEGHTGGLLGSLFNFKIPERRA